MHHDNAYDCDNEKSDFICRICDKIVYEPRQCNKCQVLWCFDCIMKWGRIYDSSIFKHQKTFDLTDYDCPKRCTNTYF